MPSTISFKVGGTWKTSVPSVKDNGSWKPVSQGYVKDGASWKLFFQASTLMVTNNTNYQADIQSAGAGTKTTNPTTAVTTGGTAPYTYQWAKISGVTFTINSPTSATTSFIITLTSGQSVSAIYRCTVTDAALAESYIDITVTARDASGGAPPPPPGPPPSNPVSVSYSVGGSPYVYGGLSYGQQVTYSVSGGYPPYTYNIYSTNCDGNANDGQTNIIPYMTYTGGGHTRTGYCNLVVTDSIGQSGNASNVPISISY